MGDKKKILIQLDGDPHPSVFDRVVAVDAGADCVFSYGGVKPDGVRDLVYGAIFTRGPEDLKSTAIFIGGSDVALGESLLGAVRKSFLGPLRVSVLHDGAGANTTAAAAVIVAGRSAPLRGKRALVLGSSGPVGRRVATLLARQGAHVLVGSRSTERAAEVAATVRTAITGSDVHPVATGVAEDLLQALQGIHVVIAAGGPGVCLLPRDARVKARSLEVAIDLNAVPPEGIEGVKGGDFAKERDGVTAYGAIGVGGLKMKIHKAAVRQLFEANDQVLDVEAVFDLGSRLAPA
jgi:methylenetetrahydrofolate/methylenetetrahydromethanopterin dehydrogenase (NADP+)